MLCLGLLCPVMTASVSAAHAYTAAEVENLYGGIAAYKEASCGASSVQELIDTGLCNDAGTTAEYYIMALSQSGSYDFSRYEKALLSFLSDNEVYSATTREKYALALTACGSTDSYISKVCDNDIGGLGLMSLVFGLHLLNNGYTSSSYSVDSLISTILGYQFSDGGWAVIGNVGDVDVTAMTAQALAPYYGARYDVTAAVDSALALLSARQLDSGGFVGMGAENLESAAQVLTALSSLGIDQNCDLRFIKNGNTVLDAMLAYRCADGSFAHLAGGGFNENATIQALYSMRAYLRTLYGQSAFYIFDRRDPYSVKSYGDTDQSNNNDTDSGDSNNAGNIKYIDGKPYIESTDAQGRKATVSIDSTHTYPTEPYHGEYTSPTGTVRFQPTATADEIDSSNEKPAAKGGYKLYVIIGIIAAALIISAILFGRKKRNIKNYIAVILLAAAVIAFVLLTNFESRGEYAMTEVKSDPVGTVTMTIRCDAVADENDLPMYIPADGVILSPTKFTISEGETAYDILLEASKKYGIQIDNRGGENSAYIAGIQYLYEYDYGSLSGWMYRVNGEFPEVGCRSCKLNDGDSIEWLYTRDIGKDLE